MCFNDVDTKIRDKDDDFVYYLPFVDGIAYPKFAFVSWETDEAYGSFNITIEGLDMDVVFSTCGLATN